MISEREISIEMSMELISDVVELAGVGRAEPVSGPGVGGNGTRREAKEGRCHGNPIRATWNCRMNISSARRSGELESCTR